MKSFVLIPFILLIAISVVKVGAQTYSVTSETELKNVKPVTVKETKTTIPMWIKNTANWWGNGKIGDDDFVQGIMYLIANDIMKIPETKQGDIPSQSIPTWVRNNALWWSEDKISNNDFVSGIQYLISNGIMELAEFKFDCLGNALCFEGTVEKIIDGDTLYVDGKKIRLTLVNTPEIGYVGYGEAMDFTTSLCPLGSTAVVDQDDGQPYDVYDRIIAKVICDDLMLNEELLHNDHAEILTDYCTKSEFSSENWAKEFGC